MAVFTRYDLPREDGETRREFNIRFGQADKNKPVNIPLAGRYIWDWFWQLSGRRRSGPESLTYAEVEAWARLLHIPIRAEEVQTIMAMDDAHVAEVRAEQLAMMERKRKEK